VVHVSQFVMKDAANDDHESIHATQVYVQSSDYSTAASEWSLGHSCLLTNVIKVPSKQHTTNNVVKQKDKVLSKPQRS